MKLDARELRRTIDVGTLGFSDTSELTPSDEPIDQRRAKDAIHFAMEMEFAGYNLYALGAPQTDKQATVTNRLRAMAAQRDTPDDWCYLRNFEDPSRPRYLRLPPGEGHRFRQRMEEAVRHVRDVLPSAFSSEDFRREAQGIASAFRESQSQDVAALEAEARELDLTMLPTPNGFVFAPVRDGKVLEQEEFLALDEAERSRLQSAISTMSQRLVERLEQYPQQEQALIEQQRELQHNTAQRVIRHALGRLRTRYRDVERIMVFLAGTEQELLSNLDRVLHASTNNRSALQLPAPDPERFFERFGVNVLTDHAAGGGAPVLYESNPSLENLIGKLDQRVEYGTPVTDFSMIRPGALHRANGGYLVLDAERILTKPFAWEALKRAQNDGAIRIESVSQLMSLTYSVSLEPEAIPLNVKLVLLGTRHLYHVLREYDPDFDALFKVVADFDDHVDLTPGNLDAYAALMAHIVAESGIRHLTAEAVCRVFEHCSRLVEDQERLSTHVTDIRDLLQEANHIARSANAERIERTHVAEAIEQRIDRLDRFRDLVQENIAKGLILVNTSGEKIGQVNGLSVVSIGHMMFGQPSRITATARLGRGELIDIERESRLGGRIHSKAVMIVSAFIGSRYAKDQPLSLHASLVFEQSYGGIEGDSASIAEVCALISAIIDRPVRQDLALTGSMDQHGAVQAIGGVNEKVEGFFDVCCAQGLTGAQGVIVPAANRHNLMLREDVVTAVAEGRFHVHTMETVDDAMALLFARPGEARADTDAIDAEVRRRIAELHEIARAQNSRDEARP